MALLAALAAFAVHAWQAKDTAQVESRVPSDGARHLLVGAGAGIVLAYFLGALVGLDLGEGKLLVGLAVGGAAAVLLWPWVDRGNLPRWVAPLGAGVLLVHLLAAGGIAYPSLAGSLWLLIAISLKTEAPASDAASGSWLRRGAVLLVICAAVIANYLTGYGPVLRSRAALAEAEQADTRSADYVRALQEAAKADPWWHEPWRRLAEHRLQQWKLRRDEDSLRAFHEALQKSIELRPHASGTYRAAGDWMRDVYAITRNPKDAEAAAQHYRRGVDLYPTSAALRAARAIAESEAGHAETAKREAREAVRLHQLTPHADKKLDAETVQRLEGVISR